MSRFAGLLAALMIWSGVVAAQEAPPDPAMLIADDVQLTADKQLIATGNVEALYQGQIGRAHV